jgi:hypothetical protein
MSAALPRVIVTFVYPPIPIRTCDYQAHYEGEEDERMATGHGRTAADAVVDLIENHPRGVQCERDCVEPTEKPEPCTEGAREGGCTCRMETVHSASIDPPEPIVDQWCPLHGWRDADREYDEMRDRQWDEALMREGDWP